MKQNKWGFSPELNRKIDAFFNDNVSHITSFPISFFPEKGISTYESEGCKHVETEVPGITKDGLTVKYNDYDGYLTITGTAKTQGTNKEIKKVVYIGESLDDKLMTANLEDGILRVSFPDGKREAKKDGATIKIQ
jgi:HSP20 family molecular chaperone IbpA